MKFGVRPAQYSYQDLPRPTRDDNTGQYSAIAAATSTNANSVYINNYGPFRNGSIYVSQRGIVARVPMDYGSGLSGAKFGSLMLLRELGHLVGKFGDDVNNKQYLKNTQLVKEACFSAKKK